MKRINIVTPMGRIQDKKRIAYVFTDNGVDGREPTQIVYASWSETERDAAFEKDKNKNWYTKSEVIVDVVEARKQALNKLNGVDNLVLGITY